MSNKSYQKYVDMVNPDDCGCMYKKRKHNKKIVPLSPSMLPPPSPPLPLPSSLQLQQPRRFTRKLYNPNSISNLNRHSDPSIHFPQSSHNMYDGCGYSKGLTYGCRSPSEYDLVRPPTNQLQSPMVVPMLYLDQLNRTREEINHQDRIALSHPIPYQERRLAIDHEDYPSIHYLPVRIPEDLAHRPSWSTSRSDGYGIQAYSSGSPRRPSGHGLSRQMRNRHKISSMDDASSMEDHVKLFKHNLQYYHNQANKFDDAFLHQIHYLMSFKHPIHNRHPFSDIDDQSSMIGQAEPASLVFHESSSEGRPSTLPSVQRRIGNLSSVCVNPSHSRELVEEDTHQRIPSDPGGVSYYSV